RYLAITPLPSFLHLPVSSYTLSHFIFSFFFLSLSHVSIASSVDLTSVRRPDALVLPPSFNKRPTLITSSSSHAHLPSLASSRDLTKPTSQGNLYRDLHDLMCKSSLKQKAGCQSPQPAAS